MSKSNLDTYEFSAEVLYEHPEKNAIKVSDGETEFWLPKSLIIEQEPTSDPNIYNFTIPQWKAEQLGLV